MGTVRDYRSTQQRILPGDARPLRRALLRVPKDWPAWALLAAQGSMPPDATLVPRECRDENGELVLCFASADFALAAQGQPVPEIGLVSWSWAEGGAPEVQLRIPYDQGVY